MTPPDVADLYERAGFGAPVTRGGRPAVVVVDLTRGFTEPRWPTGAELGDVVRATNTLVEAARACAAPVVFTAIAYSAVEAGEHGLAWLRKAPGLRALREGSPLVELDPRLARTPDELVVIKKGASAFAGTSLAAALVSWRVDTVIVSGATTSGCVRATAVDAVQAGFPVLVARECVGDRAQGPHDAALFDVQAKYGDVIAIDEALGYLADVGARGAAVA
jgi:nicotinamidase-related amidase